MHQTDSIDVITFKRLLAETVAWCGHRASITEARQSLRTLPLKTHDLSTMNQEELREVADNLFQERARLLGPNRILPNTGLARGRLLICYPEESVWDGAAQAASHEFFDVADIPAWDTWCYCGVEDKTETTFFIVSWVPPDFIEVAQKGVEVNPVESFNGFHSATMHSLIP